MALGILALALTVVLLALVIWVAIRPRNRMLWLIAIAVGEWSLWLGAIALLCVAAAIADRFIFGTPWLWLATIIFGAAIICISLYPLSGIFSSARKHHVSLSLRRYFTGIPTRDYFLGYTATGFTTHIYSDEHKLSVDVYLPTVKNDNNGACVIVVHGGSWGGGKRNDFPRWDQWLAANGFTVFDIDYRLAPQPNYPAAVDDVKTAVGWVKEHAAEFAIDPARIALLGRSAGAHLALQAAYTASDEESVCAAVSFYGPIDLPWAYGIRGRKKVHDGPGSLERFLGGAPDESDELRERYIVASPLNHVNKKTPPTFLTHGGHDMLVYWKNMYRLGEKLEAANVAHEIHFIRHGQHGFDYNINGWASQYTGEMLLRFLSKYTAPQ